MHHAGRATTTAEDILLYIPNLIGYARVLSALSSFVLMIEYPHLWGLAIVLYLSAFVGDFLTHGCSCL